MFQSWLDRLIILITLILLFPILLIIDYLLMNLGLDSLGNRILIYETAILIILTVILVLLALYAFMKELPEWKYYDYCDKGYFYGDLKEYKKAGIFFRRAIRYRKDYWEAHHGLANILFDLNEFEEAEKEFREAIRLLEKKKESIPNYERVIAEAHYGLGNTLAELGKIEKEKRNYESARDYYNEAIDEYNITDFSDAKRNLENAKKEVEELNKLINEEKATKSL